MITVGFKYSSGVECLLSIEKAQSSVLSIEKDKEGERRVLVT